MNYKASKMLGNDVIRIPFNCDQGFEEYTLVYLKDTAPYETERHLEMTVCARGALTAEDQKRCTKTPEGQCWRDLEESS